MATATGQAPRVVQIQHRVTADAAGADSEVAIAKAPFAGTVACSFVPDTVLTGADTDSRTLSSLNKGADGTGTTVIASRAFTNGVNIAAMDEGTITASVVAGATDCATDDVISAKSAHVGSTGLAKPAGLWIATFTRA